MSKKTVLITGSTDGIGKQTAVELAKRGFDIIIHGRKQERIDRTIDELRNRYKGIEIEGITADLSSLQQVVKLSENVKRKFGSIDILINNAGTYSQRKILTEDGYELTFAVNHLSHMLLTYLLLNNIVEPGRIINVSSIAHQNGKIQWGNLNAEIYYDPYGAYALSKLANILFTIELDRRLTNKQITVNALHPGVIDTKLLRAGFSIKGDSLEKGAETSVYLAVSDNVANISGAYFIDKRPVNPSSICHDEGLRTKFWEVSCDMIEKATGIKIIL
ncbi:SDR family oxidoreductase [Melioribacter sp. OK-6-Me]|uniref:SDR family oxidoreductase n=1 Tax=unclassified Melioribacter TaxID=2627329 RepID=UPI003ED8A113